MKIIADVAEVISAIQGTKLTCQSPSKQAHCLHTFSIYAPPPSPAFPPFPQHASIDLPINVSMNAPNPRGKNIVRWRYARLGAVVGRRRGTCAHIFWSVLGGHCCLAGGFGLVRLHERALEKRAGRRHSGGAWLWDVRNWRDFQQRDASLCTDMYRNAVALLE